MRKCWNCGQPTTDNDLRVCTDPICGQAAISSRAKAEEKIKAGGLAHQRKAEYMHEYHQRPEVIERRRKGQREYSQRPEVKAKRREYMREYMRKRYHRLKKLREEE